MLSLVLMKHYEVPTKYLHVLNSGCQSALSLHHGGGATLNEKSRETRGRVPSDKIHCVTDSGSFVILKPTQVEFLHCL